MIIMKQVIKPVGVRLVQERPLIDAISAGWILRRGGRVNLVEISIRTAIQ
jgi:hypothetical protein